MFAFISSCFSAFQQGLGQGKYISSLWNTCLNFYIRLISGIFTRMYQKMKCIRRMLLSSKKEKETLVCWYFYQMKDGAEETFWPHLCVDEKGRRYKNCFIFTAQNEHGLLKKTPLLQPDTPVSIIIFYFIYVFFFWEKACCGAVKDNH